MVGSAVLREEGPVRAALAEFGIERNLLIDAVVTGEIARDSCTANDPAILPGILAYGRVVRTLREHFLPLGWQRESGENFERIVAPGGKMSIAVASGDEGTGFQTQMKTKYAKGAATRKAVRNNRQLELFEEVVPSREAESETSYTPAETWLLVRRRHGDVIYSELSLPRNIGDDGRVDEWTRRILFEPIDVGAHLEALPEAMAEPIEIDIQPKTE